MKFTFNLFIALAFISFPGCEKVSKDAVELSIGFPPTPTYAFT